MFRDYRPCIPKSVSELIDVLGSVVLCAPDFSDRTGYFPGRNIDTEFVEINEGLKAIKTKLGSDRYVELTTLSAQMRAYFETDPDDSTGDTTKGRQIAIDMIDILKLGKTAEYWDE